MKVMILANETPEDFAKREDKDKVEGYMGEWYAYGGALKEAGVCSLSAALAPPSTATVVSVRDGARKVEDGPFPDAKEQLGGVFVIDVPDIDAAADWAAKCPSAKTGFVDARPIADYGQNGQ